MTIVNFLIKVWDCIINLAKKNIVCFCQILAIIAFCVLTSLTIQYSRMALDDTFMRQADQVMEYVLDWEEKFDDGSPSYDELATGAAFIVGQLSDSDALQESASRAMQVDQVNFQLKDVYPFAFKVTRLNNFESISYVVDDIKKYLLDFTNRQVESGAEKQWFIDL